MSPFSFYRDNHSPARIPTDTRATGEYQALSRGTDSPGNCDDEVLVTVLYKRIQHAAHALSTLDTRWNKVGEMHQCNRRRKR
jgi:hypothetical protein